MTESLTPENASIKEREILNQVLRQKIISWQARFTGDQFLGISNGTPVLYGDNTPLPYNSFKVRALHIHDSPKPYLTIRHIPRHFEKSRAGVFDGLNDPVVWEDLIEVPEVSEVCLVTPWNDGKLQRMERIAIRGNNSDYLHETYEFDTENDEDIILDEDCEFTTIEQLKQFNNILDYPVHR